MTYVQYGGDCTSNPQGWCSDDPLHVRTLFPHTGPYLSDVGTLELRTLGRSQGWGREAGTVIGGLVVVVLSFIVNFKKYYIFFFLLCISWAYTTQSIFYALGTF
ncbi:hypothetical protein F4804DRAFT_166251 [Jackrogersella minutella]|nr:hypothetical protein F4804DRAFT_166251 [Jackrogersella minutella]